MPAKRSRIKNFVPISKTKVWYLFLLLFILLLFASIMFLALAKESLWDGKSKLSYVIYRPNQIEVMVLDPSYKELTTVIIPQDTLVEVARGLGKTKIKNVYEIGVNEGLGGRLLSETITFSLALPAYHYVYDKSVSQKTGALSFLNNFQTIFISSESSFSFLEKLRLFFALSLGKDLKRTAIKLDQTSFLKKTTLVDGSEGYIKTPFMPQSVQSLFGISDEIFTVSVVNYLGSVANIDDLTETFSSLGGKVILVRKVNETKKVYFKNKQKVFCELRVKDKKLANEVKKYFQICNLVVFDQTEKSMEIEILSLE